MRKFLLAALAVVYTLATLLMSVTSYITISKLRRENAELNAQVISLQDAASQVAPTLAVPQTILVDVPNSYCNLIIDHWEADLENLNIVTAYAQAVVISNAPSATAERAQLVLKLNGEKLSAAEMDAKLAELKKELFNLRFQQAVNKLSNPMRISAVKKDIARIKTVQRDIELHGANS